MTPFKVYNNSLEERKQYKSVIIFNGVGGVGLSRQIAQSVVSRGKQMVGWKQRE